MSGKLIYGYEKDGKITVGRAMNLVVEIAKQIVKMCRRQNGKCFHLKDNTTELLRF